MLSYIRSLLVAAAIDEGLLWYHPKTNTSIVMLLKNLREQAIETMITTKKKKKKYVVGVVASVGGRTAAAAAAAAAVLVLVRMMMALSSQ